MPSIDPTSAVLRFGRQQTTLLPTTQGSLLSHAFIDPAELLGCEAGDCLAPFSSGDWAWGLIQVLSLAGAYGYVLYAASEMLSEGSELLLLVPSIAGLVGSVVLPILGAVPDGTSALGLTPNPGGSSRAVPASIAPPQRCIRPAEVEVSCRARRRRRMSLCLVSAKRHPACSIRIDGGNTEGDMTPPPASTLRYAQRTLSPCPHSLAGAIMLFSGLGPDAQEQLQVGVC